VMIRVDDHTAGKHHRRRLPRHAVVEELMATGAEAAFLKLRTRLESSVKGGPLRHDRIRPPGRPVALAGSHVTGRAHDPLLPKGLVVDRLFSASGVRLLLCQRRVTCLALAYSR
jgi:hypothetical protein